MTASLTINPVVNQVTVTQNSNKVIISAPGPQGPAGTFNVGTIPVIYPITNTSGSIGYDTSYVPASATYSSSALYSTNASSAIYSSSAGISASTAQTNFSNLTISGSQVATQAYVLSSIPASATYAGSALYANQSGNSSSTSQTNFTTLTLSGSNVATQAYVLANIPASAQYAGSALYATNAGSASYSSLAGSATNAGNSTTTSQTNFNTLTLSGSNVATQAYVLANIPASATYSGSALYANNSGSLGGIISGSYALLSSPAFIGTPTAPTAGSGTNTTQVATTAYVRGEISNLVSSAPTTLDTLNELAAALGNNPNFATTTASQIGLKADTTYVDSQDQAYYASAQAYATSRGYVTSSGSVAYATNSSSSIYASSAIYATNSASSINASSAGYATNAGNSNTTSQTNFTTLTLSGSISMGGNAIVGANSVQVTGLTGATQNPIRMAGATNSGPPVSGTYAVGDFVIDNTATIWICVAAGTPGTWSPTIQSSLVNRTATATAGPGEFTLFNGSTALQLITLPANPQNGALYQIKNISSNTVYLNAGTNSISLSGQIYPPYFTANVNTTSSLTNISSSNNLVVGMALSSTYVTTGTTITAINSPSITMSANGTTAATNQTIKVLVPIPTNTSYTFVYNNSGNTWYTFITTDLSKMGGVTPTTNGGTGLNSIGTANQVLRVNSTATALEWGNSGSANYSNDSASLGGTVSSSYALQSYANSASLTAYNSASAYTATGAYNNQSASVGYASSAGFVLGSNVSGTVASATYSSSALYSSSVGGNLVGGLLDTSSTSVTLFSTPTTTNIGGTGSQGTRIININSGVGTGGQIINIGNSSFNAATENINIGTGSGNTATRNVNIATGSISTGLNNISIGSGSAQSTASINANTYFYGNINGSSNLTSIASLSGSGIIKYTSASSWFFDVNVRDVYTSSTAPTVTEVGTLWIDTTSSAVTVITNIDGGTA